MIRHLLTENWGWTSFHWDLVIPHFKITLSFEIQIRVPCWEMGRLVIGLEPLKGTKVQCGVAAWTLMLCVQHLAPLIFLRMLFKFLPFMFWNSWIYIDLCIPFQVTCILPYLGNFLLRPLSLSLMLVHMVASGKMLNDQHIINSINLERFYNMSGILFAGNCGMHWQGMNYSLLSISILFEHAHFQR